MRTPAGTECPYFYGDYYRGRSQEECRLLAAATPPEHWTPDLCRTCPVPAIARANTCPHLILSASIKKTFIGLRRQVKIEAYCTKSHKAVTEPQIGCGECHYLSNITTESKTP